MKVTLPDGTTIEGSYEEVRPWLPPAPPKDWQGAPILTASLSDAGVDTTVYGGWHLDDEGKVVPNVCPGCCPTDTSETAKDYVYT